MTRSSNSAYARIMGASLDAYEAAARTVSEIEWMLARHALLEPLSSFAAICADTTRDIAAVQLSTARWLLDL